MYELEDDEVILCCSSKYEQKYYLNDEFDGLPQGVKDELKIMCVLYTEDIGGVLVLKFDKDGDLHFEVSSDEGYLLFDDIGSVLKIKEYQESKKDLLEALEMYFKVFYLGENYDIGD